MCIRDSDKISPIAKRLDAPDELVDMAAHECHECKFSIYEDDVFCGGCGKLVKWVHGITGRDGNCRWCGNSFHNNANYCAGCGNLKKQ